MDVNGTANMRLQFFRNARASHGQSPEIGAYCGMSFHLNLKNILHNICTGLYGAFYAFVFMCLYVSSHLAWITRFCIFAGYVRSNLRSAKVIPSPKRISSFPDVS